MENMKQKKFELNLIFAWTLMVIGILGFLLAILTAFGFVEDMKAKAFSPEWVSSVFAAAIVGAIFFTIGQKLKKRAKKKKD
jgi:tellurite resistance protein TehA-like permease